MKNIMIHINNTYAGIIVLTAAEARLISTAQPFNKHKGICPRGAQWKCARALELDGLIEPVIVEHVGCSLGEFKLTKKGQQVLECLHSHKNSRSA